MDSQKKVNELQATALQAKKEMSDSILMITEELKESASIRKLKNYYEKKDKDAMYNEFDFGTYEEKLYKALLFYLLLTAIRVTNSEKDKFDFIPSRYIIEETIRNHVINLTAQLSQETKRALYITMDKMIVAGDSPKNSIILLIESAGLNARQALSIANYKDKMKSNGLKETFINDTLKKYSNKKLMERAETISDTELSKSARMGQIDSYRQAVNQGKLDRTQYQLKWILNRDERLCVYCAQMYGATREINEPWSTPLGIFDIPQIHPNCRCDEELILKD